MTDRVSKEERLCSFSGCSNVYEPWHPSKIFCSVTHKVTCEICEEIFSTRSKSPATTCSKECRNKKRALTNTSRYGVTNQSHRPEIVDRIQIATAMTLSDPKKKAKILEKKMKTNLQKRGVLWPMQSEAVKEKAKTTKLERYGPSMSSLAGQKESKLEREVRDFLELIYPGAIEKDRSVLKGKELDFYLPSLKMAIEFNGNYWHDDIETRRDKYGNYPSYWHQWKHKRCAEVGIDLFFIWQNDWEGVKEEVCWTILGLIEMKRLFPYLDIPYSDSKIDEKQGITVAGFLDSLDQQITRYPSDYF